MTSQCWEVILAGITAFVTIVLAWSTWKANGALVRRDEQERAYHLAELRATGRSIWNRVRPLWTDRHFNPELIIPWIEKEEDNFEKAGYVVALIPAEKFLELIDSIKFMREYLERARGERLASLNAPGFADPIWEEHLNRIRDLLPQAIGLPLSSARAQ